MIGPRPSPIVIIASSSPIYLIFWSGSRIVSILRDGIADTILENPCHALKHMATTIIALFDCINVMKPKQQIEALFVKTPKYSTLLRPNKSIKYGVQKAEAKPNNP